MKPTKKSVQEENEALKREIEQWQRSDDKLQAENKKLRCDIGHLKDTTAQQDKQIDGLRAAVSEREKEIDDDKKQAAEYKRELNDLTDTKTVLNKLMSILRSPHNDYQKIVNELNEMLGRERARANDLEQELRNIRFDTQQNRFLDGKVQAYEMMLNARLDKSRQCGLEVEGIEI